MNNTALLTALITSPSAAFAELRERPRFWLPLIVLTLASAGLIVWYYGLVDISWLIDRVFSSNERVANMPADARARAMSMMTRNTMMISSVVSVLILIPVVSLVQAVYYLLAGKVTGAQQSFQHWFALVCWSSLPALVAQLASAVLLLTESSPMQVDNAQLQVLSLNELFFHLPLGAPGASLLASLTLITPWTWALSIIGVRTWTQRSWLFSATFVLLPSVVVYACWGFFTFR